MDVVKIADLEDLSGQRLGMKGATSQDTQVPQSVDPEAVGGFQCAVGFRREAACYFTLFRSYVEVSTRPSK